MDSSRIPIRRKRFAGWRRSFGGLEGVTCLLAVAILVALAGCDGSASSQPSGQPDFTAAVDKLVPSMASGWSRLYSMGAR